MCFENYEENGYDLRVGFTNHLVLMLYFTFQDPKLSTVRISSSCVNKNPLIWLAGTVAMSIAEIDMMKKRDKVEQWLEDGTTTFLSIAALRHGFASISRFQRSSINMWVMYPHYVWQCQNDEYIYKVMSIILYFYDLILIIYSNVVEYVFILHVNIRWWNYFPKYLPTNLKCSFLIS